MRTKRIFSERLGGRAACCVMAGALMMSSPALADQGMGSIRTAGPTQRSPSRAAPSQAAPSQKAPSQKSPSQAEPSRAEPPRAEPSRSAPSQAEPPRAEPSRAEPSRAEPSRAEPSRAEPPRAEPPRAEPTPRAPEPQRRDWDENDEDARHYGGFGRPLPPPRPARGAHIHGLPPDHWAFDWDHHHYFLGSDGIFYEPQDNGDYIVVEAPVGADVPSLPSDTVAIDYNGTTYYYSDGTFFAPQDGGFAVVGPPPGITVPELPSDATMVVENGVSFYQFNGFNYTPTIEDGATAYIVTPS